MAGPDSASDLQTERATRETELEEITRAMTAGHLLPGGPVVEVRETHASRVFLTASEVYKLKKPVNLGFLDYSTLSRRRNMCEQEVSLNRRLAPDVYLGVERLTRSRGGELRLNERGRAVDYLVHMRRLPDERSLNSLLRSGGASQEDVRRVGATLGEFHMGAEPAPSSLGLGTFRRNATENLEQLDAFWPARLPRKVLSEIDTRFDELMKQCWPVVERRARSGRVRDGHGDLRMEHVYLEGPVQVIDCVEFSKRYRASDTALDLAFLVMDMAANGYPEMVVPLLEGYRDRTDDGVSPVLPLYSCYRSLVRAKVAFILEAEGDVPDEARAAARLEARLHLHYAVRMLRNDGRPLLITVGGLPGTGKTTLARALAVATGSTTRSADEIRKRLAGLSSNVHPEEGINSGIYSDDMNRRVYGALIDEADAALRLGRNCILDATFRRTDDLAAVKDLAERLGAQLVTVRCEAPEATVVERLQRREVTPDPWSDATVDTYRAHRSESESASEPSNDLAVSTTLPLIEQVDLVLSHLWE